MNRLSRTRSRARDTDRPPLASRIWTGFMIFMLLASLFSALIEPVTAAPGDSDDQQQEAAQLVDTDLDGVDDATETANGTDPNNPDTDGDGVSDGQDQDPFNPPQALDSDGDGIDDATETANGTDPNNSDTDGDGLIDSQDPDPLNAPQVVDSDGDGVTDDVDNCPVDQNPNQEDTDGNGTGDACDVQQQLVSNGSVSATLFLCPEGTDLNSANAVTCNLYDPANPGTFELQPANVQLQTAAGGDVLFTDVVPGQVTLSLDDPTTTGFLAACTTDQPEEGQSNTKPYASASSNGIIFDLKSAENVECDWFAIAQQAVIEMYHTKYICPADFDFTQAPNMTRQQWQNACQEPVVDVSFTVTGQNNYNETLPADPNANNTAYFDDVPLGQFTVTEQMPEGHYFLIRWCVVEQNGDPLGDYQSSGGGEFGGELQQGTLRCEWFNIIPYAHLVIIKINCPEGFAYETLTTPQDFLPCNLPVEPPVEFKVTIQGPNQQTLYDETHATDPNQNNAAIFRDLPGGEATIEELIPEGYEVVRRYCGFIPPRTGETPQTKPPALVAEERNVAQEVQADQQQYREYPVADGPITLDLVPGYIWGCVYINMPVQAYDVTLYKWECEQGTMPNQPLEYYQGGLPDQDTGPCEVEQAGVDFNLIDGNGTRTITSDTNGVDEPFVPDANGSFTLSEIVPEGFGDPFRYCLPLNPPEPNGVQPPAWQTGGMGTDITVTVIPGEYSYQCWFYNIPVQEYTVTVYKWECPEGTMYGQTDPSYYSGECATEQPGVEFTLTDGRGDTPFTSDTNGRQLDGVILDANGRFTITETVPTGYGDPVRYCQPLNPPEENGVGPYPWETPATGTSVTVEPPAGSDLQWQCWFYNIPYEYGDVTVYKWECPEGTTPDPTYTAYSTACTTAMPGVEFSLTAQIDGQGFTPQLTDATGMVSWSDVPGGSISLDETIPPGYDPHPFVACRVIPPAQDGTILSVVGEDWTPVNTINGALNLWLPYGYDLECHFFNRYLGPGEITVFKYFCPEGYDWTAWDANPLEDCSEGYNGVNFILDQPDPEVDLQSMTGDSINGAVYFGGLTPGDYTLTEQVPAGTASVFVWDCVGINYSSVHPKPLSVGPSLDIRIAGGDSIECYWFNVPTPQTGWMVVKKFDCTTPTYVKDVDCYTNTTGQQFDLQAWNGSTWVNVQSGTTNATGQLTFMNLEGGEYRLVEPGKMACLMKSSNITSGGNIGVVLNQQTTVHVYNCSTGTKPPPKTPTKYPNTGVPPMEGEMRTEHGSALLGLFGLAGAATVSRRTFLKRAAIGTTVGVTVVGGGSVALTRALASQTLVPLDATVTPEGTPSGTPAADCLYPATPEGLSSSPEAGSAIQGVGTESTPDASASTPEVCARGAVPVHIMIESIGVDYPIEYLEIIEGEMVQPTGADAIAWYKETARLGEKGNGLYAGHLNWWNMPEGPFFLLETLVEGDVVEVEGDDGETYRYIVQWTQDFPIDEEPPDEALGTSDDEVITMITCGGEWNADVALYDHRTVVRAIRDVDFVPGTPAPGSTAPA